MKSKLHPQRPANSIVGSYLVPKILALVILSLVVGLPINLMAQNSSLQTLTTSIRTVRLADRALIQEADRLELESPDKGAPPRPTRTEPTEQRPANQSIDRINFSDPFAQQSSGEPSLKLIRPHQTVKATEWLSPNTLKLVSEVPSNLRHDRLYFEQARLEQGGYSRRPVIEEFCSAKRFFGTAVLLPLTRSGRQSLRGIHIGY